MAYNTIADLDSLISTLNTLSNQARQSENQRYRRDASVYDDYNADIEGTYSNAELGVIEQRVDNYISQYGSNFNDLSMENFTLLKDKIKFQKEDNSRYESLLDKNDNEVKNYSNIMNEFRAVQDMPDGEFEYNDKVLSKDQHLQEIKTKMLESIDSYSAGSEMLQNSFSKRLNDPSQIKELYKLQSSGEVISYGLYDAAKDNYIDTYEFDAYSAAIRDNKYEHIKNYKAQKADNDSRILQSSAKVAEDLYTQINNSDAIEERYYKFSDNMNIYRNADEMGRIGQGNYSDEQRKVAKDVIDTMLKQELMPGAKKGESFTFEELLADPLNIDKGINLYSELNSQIETMFLDADKAHEKLKRVDKNYTSASGGQFGLESLQFSFYNPRRNPDYVEPTIEEPPKEVESTKVEETIAPVSDKLDIKEYDVSSDTKDTKSWAVNKMKKTGSELNELKKNIDSYQYGDLDVDRASAHIVAEFLEKEEPKGAKITYEELISMDKNIEDDKAILNKLWEEYESMTEFGIRANDERRRNIQKQIAEIFTKYDASHSWNWRRGNPATIMENRPQDFGVLKSQLRGLGRFKQLKEQHDKISKKYEEDLIKTSTKK